MSFSKENLSPMLDFFSIMFSFLLGFLAFPLMVNANNVLGCPCVLEDSISLNDSKNDEHFCNREVIESKDSKEELKRRGLPAPFDSPPFPSAEYQGYPLIGVPPDETVYPFMKCVYKLTGGNCIKESGVKVYGWVNASGNLSTCKNSNMPFSYWFYPNRVVLDQFIFRLERSVDTVQTSHIDIGFRSSYAYGTDYRYMTAGGWTSK